MSQDDIEYVLEILEDAIENKDWDPILEAQQYLSDFLTKKGTRTLDEE